MKFKNIAIAIAILCLVMPASAQTGFFNSQIKSSADSTTAFTIVAGGTVTSLPFKLHTGTGFGQKFPSTVNFKIASDEDTYTTADSTNYINKLLVSFDGTNYEEYTAFRDTVTTEDGFTFKRLTNLPQGTSFKYQCQGRMASGDSLNVTVGMSYEYQ